MSSTLTPIFSQRLATSLIKVIFVARNALDAYLINSAPLLLVVKYFAPLLISGKYNFFIILIALLTFVPTIILSGYLKSLTASPSLKNSGNKRTRVRRGSKR